MNLKLHDRIGCPTKDETHARKLSRESFESTTSCAKGSYEDNMNDDFVSFHFLFNCTISQPQLPHSACAGCEFHTVWELSERLADRERRRLRLRRRAELATTTGEAAAMAAVMDLAPEDAAVALAVTGQSAHRPSMLIAGFVQNLSKTSDRGSTATSGGGGASWGRGSGGGGVGSGIGSRLPMGSSRVTSGGNRLTPGGNRLTLGGNRLPLDGEFTTTPEPIKPWSASVFDGAKKPSVMARKSIAVRKGVSRVGGRGGDRGRSFRAVGENSTETEVGYDLSLLSNFQTRRLVSIFATADDDNEDDDDDDDDDDAAASDCDLDTFATAAIAGAPPASTTTKGSNARSGSAFIPLAAAGAATVPASTRRQRRTNNTRTRAAHTPTKFFIADSEIPSIMPPYVSTYALWLFDDDHPLRRACQAVVSSRWYAFLSYAFIATSLGAVLGTDPVVRNERPCCIP